MAPTPPYRAAAPIAGPRDAAHWESRCAWSERWEAERFAATVDHSRRAVAIVGVCAGAAGGLAALFSPFGPDKGFALGFGLVTSLAVFVPLVRYAWRGACISIEVTRAKMTTHGREARSVSTLGVRDIEAFQSDADDGSPAAWSVRYTCEGRVEVLPIWSSEAEARMRAERLRAVIGHFQKDA